MSSSTYLRVLEKKRIQNPYPHTTLKGPDRSSIKEKEKGVWIPQVRILAIFRRNRCQKSYEKQIENRPTSIRNWIFFNFLSHLLTFVSFKKMQEKYIWIGGFQILNSREGIEFIRITDLKIEKFKTNRLVWNLTGIWIWDELRQSATNTRRPKRRDTRPATRGTRVRRHASSVLGRDASNACADTRTTAPRKPKPETDARSNPKPTASPCTPRVISWKIEG